MSFAPLNSIIGFAGVLLRRKGSPGPDEASYVGRIHKNGLNLLVLINDILDLSKIEAGRMGDRDGRCKSR